MIWLVARDAIVILRDACVLGAVTGSIYFLVAAFLVRRLPTRGAARRGVASPVTILVPLCGAEPGLHERLSSLCTQEYDASVQIVCGVQSRQDAAIGIVAAVSAEHPGSRIDIVADERLYGSNRKISNLINMVRRARYRALVMLDSDIEISPDYIATVMGTLQQPHVGAVTCLYHGVAGEGVWSSLSALAIDTYFIPNAVVALYFSLAKPCFGASIAMRRDTLARIGGFRSLSNCLFDDYAIGQRVRATGAEVAVPPVILGHLCQERSAFEMLRNQFRRARTIRAIAPAGNAGAVVTHPFALAIIAAALGSSAGLPLVLFAFVCRLVLAVAAERMLGVTRVRLWLLPLHDLLSFAVYAIALFGGGVSWRGRRFRLGAGGSLAARSS